MYEDWDSIKTSDVVTGSLEPKPASQKMEFSVKRDIFDDGTVYFVALKAIDDQGGFQLLYLIITELKSHMTC